MAYAGTGSGEAFNAVAGKSEVAIAEDEERRQRKLRAAVEHTAAQVEQAESQLAVAAESAAKLRAAADDKIARAQEFLERKQAEAAEALSTYERG